MALIGLSREEKIWNYLNAKIKNSYGVAALIGNLDAESGLNPKNLENIYEEKLGYSNEEYCNAVDCGAYDNFVKDCAGWGLAQWTYWTRKKALYEYAKSKKKSIGDLEMQLEFLYKELNESYKSVLDTLKKAKSIREASDVVLLKFECPSDQSETVKIKRASFGQKYYNKYSNEVKNMSFKMRTTKPEAGNKYYITKAKGGYSDAIKGKPTDPDCDVLSNCVGYAYGRFNEIGGYGKCKYLYPTNAENFMRYKGDLKVGQTPKVGACMVWQKGATLNGSDGAGHVAIVEKVVSDTEVYTSESGYKASRPFWNQTRKKGSGNWGQNANYKFLGFIYHPDVKDEPIAPKPVQKDTKIDTVKEVQAWLNKSYNAGLVVDGKYGPKTKAALVKVLQKALGVQIDGNYGPKTNAAVKDKNLEKGSKGEMVKALQGLLVCNGYKKAYVDGSYGTGTFEAVKSYQDKNGLKDDGVAGSRTFSSLCK